MNLHRRSLTLAGVALCASPALLARTQPASGDYPAHPIKVIVPFAPGGVVDVMSRVLADAMSQQLKQTLFVENRPGATSTLGAAQLKSAAADGYTLLFGTSGIELMNPSLFKKLPYAVSDLQKVSVIYDSSIALVVPKKIGVNSFNELIAYAKRKGNGMTFGSWGTGSSAHLFGTLLENAFGIQLVHVPYKGEVAALTDMARGDLDMSWASPNGARTFRDKGDAVIIGVTGSGRSPGLPEVPTFAEQGFEALKLGLYGVAYAPRGTPRPVVETVQQAIQTALAQPAVRERFATMGLTPMGSTTAEFETLFARERSAWTQLIVSSKASLD